MPYPTADAQYDDTIRHPNLPRIIADEMVYDAAEERASFDINMASEFTNEDQRRTIEHMVNYLESDNPTSCKTVFLDGPGGTGKTFVENTLLHYVRGKGDIALPMASSGIAALLLKGGRTVHNRTKAPIRLNESSACGVTFDSHLGELLRRAKLLIWDEAPMSHVLLLRCVDQLLRDLMKTPNTPFGGKCVLLAGDFRQVLPVVPRGSRSQINAASIQRYGDWHKFDKLHLKQNVRVQRMLSEDDPDADRVKQFCEYLLPVGEGRIPAVEELGSDWISLRNDMCLRAGATLDELIDMVYPNLKENMRDDPRFFADRAIMSPLNSEVDRINTIIQDRMEGTTRVLTSIDDCVDAEQSVLYPTEFLHTVTPSGFPPHTLELKEGCPVMLLRNMDPKRGLANGTRLIVKKIGVRILECEIMNGSCAGNQVYIPRITMTCDDNAYPFEFTRHQFPVRLSFAMTMNKSQGQSLGFVGLYLPHPVFSHRHLYIAMSRVSHPENIKICFPHVDTATIPDWISHNAVGAQYTLNIVHKEALLRS